MATSIALPSSRTRAPFAFFQEFFAPPLDIRHARNIQFATPHMIEFGHGTHVGLRRARNEDTYYADAVLGLFLVADGMGGHLHGEVASALVRDSMVELVSRGHNLAEAIRGADEHLLAQADGSSTAAMPKGSTIAALRLSDDGYEAAWVGDSCIYATGRELRQLNHDQSLIRALVETGKLDPAHAMQRANRNVQTQALGITAVAQLHIGMARGRVTPGMGFLLCSDGLIEDLDTASIARTVARTDLAAQECVDQLLLDALDCGGKDNITAILVRSS